MTATLVIFTEAAELLEVQAKDVQSMIDAKWLNEKLIFFRLWVGRIGGVDVILDVEEDKFILMEPMAYGRLLWEQAKASCKADPQLPACKEQCVGLR